MLQKPSDLKIFFLVLSLSIKLILDKSENF